MGLLRDVRKPALGAAVMSALAYSWPLYNMLGSAQRVPALALAAILSQYVSVAFYFVLSRQKGPVSLPAHLRRLCRIAAVFQLLATGVSVPGWYQGFTLYVARARAFGGDFNADLIAQVMQSAMLLSSLMYLLMLVALSRAGDESRAELSGGLVVASRVAAMVAGLWVVFGIVMTGYFPKQIWDNQEAIIRSHQGDQVLQALFLGAVRGLVMAACTFAAPYVVAMSIRSRETDPLPR